LRMPNILCGNNTLIIANHKKGIAAHALSI
jgi:hypothetical protein